MEKKDETTFGASQIVLYQPDNSIRLDVKLENETVWLTQMQMVVLFGRDKSVISRHIKNIYKEGELDESATVAKYATVQNENGRCVERQIEFYNLDMIISVGYRVKSKRGILFRQWATNVIKDYLLKCYVINQRFERIEQRVSETEKKIEFFVKTALPPVEGIFYDGQIFDAYKFAADLIKSAKSSIVLIDNYIDESVLLLLSKRTNSI
jgi:tetrahydromethanopterin S-methyltransferase subunit G